MGFNTLYLSVWPFKKKRSVGNTLNFYLLSGEQTKMLVELNENHDYGDFISTLWMRLLICTVDTYIFEGGEEPSWANAEVYLCHSIMCIDITA